jgi:hypothetical protein
VEPVPLHTHTSTIARDLLLRQKKHCDTAEVTSHRRRRYFYCAASEPTDARDQQRPDRSQHPEEHRFGESLTGESCTAGADPKSERRNDG